MVVGILWRSGTRGIDADGVGSKVYLTRYNELTGKTLCGRSYPANNGVASSFGDCKACFRIAKQDGAKIDIDKWIGSTGF